MRLCTLALSTVLVAGSAVAQPMLTAVMTCDNAFTAYISQDPNVAGTQFLSGNNWGSVYTGSIALDNGPGTYYLHIIGQDFGLPAAMIGSFSVTGGALFTSTGESTLNSNIATFQSNNTGFGNPFNAPNDLGANGIGPWGFHAGIDPNAHWIWDPSNSGTVYFTTAIRFVPAPGAGIGFLGGLALVARRRRS